MPVKEDATAMKQLIRDVKPVSNEEALHRAAPRLMTAAQLRAHANQQSSSASAATSWLSPRRWVPAVAAASLVVALGVTAVQMMSSPSVSVDLAGTPTASSGQQPASDQWGTTTTVEVNGTSLTVAPFAVPDTGTVELRMEHTAGNPAALMHHTHSTFLGKGAPTYVVTGQITTPGEPLTSKEGALTVRSLERVAPGKYPEQELYHPMSAWRTLAQGGSLADAGIETSVTADASPEDKVFMAGMRALARTTNNAETRAVVAQALAALPGTTVTSTEHDGKEAMTFSRVTTVQSGTEPVLEPSGDDKPQQLSVTLLTATGEAVAAKGASVPQVHTYSSAPVWLDATFNALNDSGACTARGDSSVRCDATDNTP